ncbi:hypothetical protein TZ03_18625 [Pseudomonas sp. 10-1B]|uniref:hypothetical protein n=1 Tax=Pseudomonas sp. 10-1B TaxID=1546029 RepID=UPI00061EA9EB|nr:hypothetical protein [Pseudomonas sp. 10-1B]KIY39125.1 hypothetical protein TZ03_18625 [Pseudomonas sp. 10-1B]
MIAIVGASEQYCNRQGVFPWEHGTTCRLDARTCNLFVLAFQIQSEKRFSLVGQFDKRPSRFLVLWLLNNDHNKPALKNTLYLGQPQALPLFS